jgi:hypothetical protein
VREERFLKVTRRPVHYQDVLAIVYHILGIDPHALIRDVAGRPVSFLTSTAAAVHELI